MGRVEGKDCGIVLINQVYFEKGTSNKKSEDTIETKRTIAYICLSLLNCAQAEVTF